MGQAEIDKGFRDRVVAEGYLVIAAVLCLAMPFKDIVYPLAGGAVLLFVVLGGVVLLRRVWLESKEEG